MRKHHTLAAGMILAGGAAWPAGPGMAQPTQISVCPSQEKAQQVAQGRGQAVPEGCRTVTVTRVDSLAEPICGVDFTQANQGGLLGAVTDAVSAPQWWTACANLRVP